MDKKKEKIKRKVYPDLSNMTLTEINKRLEKFGVSIDFLFDDGIEFTYNSTLDIRHFPGDISFVDREKNLVVLSYLEGFSSIEFFIGGDWGDEDEPYLNIPIYNLL